MGNNADIELLAGLSVDSSEAEILKAIKIIEKRLQANTNAKIKLNVDIDETIIRSTVEKLQNILKGKELKIETKTSIEAITKEVDAMADIVTVAKKAANEKLEFAKANERVRDSADDTTDAVNRERNAMESLDDVETILNGINGCGQNGNSVFQRFGNTLRDAFSTYTAVNLLEEGLNKVAEAGKEALEIVKEFDDINVDLQMATGTDKGYVKQLLNDYSELGGELGTLTQSVAESADTFLRQGRSIADTNKLIEDSIVLSKIAKTDGENASEILTATINGFKLAANEGSKVNDVLSSIDLNSASDASGIGLALTKVASMANNAGVSLEKTAAMIATIKDVTQDADTTIGTSLKTVLSRMNSIRAGKFIDEETGEPLNDVEKVLGSINVSMRDVNGQFKEAEIIIDEVGAKWKTLDGNTQKAVTTAMGGTYQANKLVALFDNYEKVIELTNIAENSTGQALEKFNESYLPSLEAKTQALQNSLQQLATTTVSDDLYASVLDVSKEIVDLTTETGILKSALIGLGAGGSLYAFSQLAGFLSEAAQGFSNFSEALNMVNRGAITSANDMQALVDLSHGLSNSQMRLLLSTNNLTDAQKIALMVANGVEQELAEQQLRTWGLINAQNTATSATVTLTSAVRGLMATLVANPIILVTMAVTAGVTAFNKYKEAQEEVIQTARESATVYKDTANSVDDYVAKYKELRKAFLAANGDEEKTYDVKQQLLTLQTELNEKFSNEADRLNLVTEAYKDQTEAIKELSKASANEFLNSNRKGIEKADKEMNKEKTYNLGSMNGLVNADEVEILEEIKAIAEENGIDVTKSGFKFTGNANEATEAIHSFMNDIKELQEESGETSEIMSGIFDGILDNSSEALGKTDSIIDKYGEIYEQAQMAQIVTSTTLSTGYNNAISAVEAYNEAVLKSENPYNDEDVKEAWDNLQTVKKAIQENEVEWGQYSNIMNNVFASANDTVYSFYDMLKNDESMTKLVEGLRGLTDIELQSMSNDGKEDSFDKLIEKAKEYGLEIQDVIDLLIELGVAQGKVSGSKDSPSISISDTFAMENSQKNATLLSDYKDQLLEVESAYQTCLSAKEEYDKQGYLSIETLEKVLLLGDEYLQYLFDEQGNVKLDAEAFKELALARINDMEAQALNNLAQNIQQITDEASATEYLANKQNTLANSYTDVAASALLALSSISGFSDSEALQKTYSAFKEQYNQIKGLFASTRKGLGNAYSGISTTATDEIEQATKKYIESYMDFQKKSLERGAIDYDTYCNTVSNMLKSMYNQGKISAADYWGYVEDLQKQQLSIMDRVISAVTNRIDDEIDSIKAEQDEIQNTIDKLREENEERERAYTLDKARYDLARLQAQRTQYTFTSNKGFVYTRDNDAIREKYKEVKDLEFEELIAGLEKEKDALDDSIEKLEDYKEQWQSVTKEYEKEQDRLLAEQILGADWESQILSGRVDTLESFKTAYIAIQRAIVKAAWDSANEQNKAMNSIGTGSTNGSGDISDDEDTSKYRIVNTRTGKVTYDNLSAKGANNYFDKLSEKQQQIYTIEKYAKGTENAKRGISEVSENGDEIIVDNYGNAVLAKGHQFYNFEGGERVIKRDKSKELLKNQGNLVPIQPENMSEDFRKLYEYSQTHQIIPNYMPNYSMPKQNFPRVNNTTNTQTSINIGDIHVHEVQNVDGLIKGVIHKFPNKMLQELHKK